MDARPRRGEASPHTGIKIKVGDVKEKGRSPKNREEGECFVQFCKSPQEQQVDPHRHKGEGETGRVFDQVQEIDPVVNWERADIPEIAQWTRDDQNEQERQPDPQGALVGFVLIFMQPAAEEHT